MYACIFVCVWVREARFYNWIAPVASLSPKGELLIYSNKDETFSALKRERNISNQHAGKLALYSKYLYFQKIGPYSVSKTALLGLIRVLSQELASAGVRVNGLAPGIIKTDFSTMVIFDLQKKHLLYFCQHDRAYNQSNNGLFRWKWLPRQIFSYTF